MPSHCNPADHTGKNARVLGGRPVGHPTGRVDPTTHAANKRSAVAAVKTADKVAARPAVKTTFVDGKPARRESNPLPPVPPPAYLTSRRVAVWVVYAHTGERGSLAVHQWFAFPHKDSADALAATLPGAFVTREIR